MRLRQCGSTGHGWYWQCLAEAAEILILELWGMPFDIGRKESALMELQAGDGCEAIPFLCGSFHSSESGHVLAQWKGLVQGRVGWQVGGRPLARYCQSLDA
jgi:hypothetical protein